MNILKLKVAMFGFLALIAMSVLMTSCEQDALPTPEAVETTLKKQKPLQVDVNEQGEKTYIVMFKTDTGKKKARENELKSIKSRENMSKTTKRMSDDFKKEVETMTKKLNVSSEKVRDYYTFFDGASMKLTAQEAKDLENNPLIESIETDEKIRVELPKPEELSGEAPPQNATKSYTDYYGWFNYNTGGYSLNGANKYTWIWIVDTGIDLNHPELNVVTNLNYAKSFVGGTPDDCNGHGTHVAGIAAAKANNYGMVGISEGAWVVPVRILDCYGYEPYGTTFRSQLIASLNHIYSGSISGDVVNMSVRQYGSLGSSLTIALNNLNNKGVYVVMAAGNENTPAHQCYPARYNNSLAKTVASMDYNGTMSWFSNYGRNPVDYIATGAGVYSTYKNGGFTTMSGTSMATPVVAGIIHARGALPTVRGYTYARNEYYPKAGL